MPTDPIDDPRLRLLDDPSLPRRVRALGDDVPLAAATSVHRAGDRFRRRRRTGLGAAAAVVLALVVGAGALLASSLPGGTDELGVAQVPTPDVSAGASADGSGLVLDRAQLPAALDPVPTMEDLPRSELIWGAACDARPHLSGQGWAVVNGVVQQDVLVLEDEATAQRVADRLAGGTPCPGTPQLYDQTALLGDAPEGVRLALLPDEVGCAQPVPSALPSPLPCERSDGVLVLSLTRGAVVSAVATDAPLGANTLRELAARMVDAICTVPEAACREGEAR